MSKDDFYSDEELEQALDAARQCQCSACMKLLEEHNER